MTYLQLKKEFHQHFSFKERFSAVFGGFIFAFLAFFMVFIVLGEFIVVYMYLLYPLVVLLIASTMGFVILWFYFIKKALILKKPSIKDEFLLNKYFSYYLVVIESLVLIIGLLFLFIFIPMLWV